MTHWIRRFIYVIFLLFALFGALVAALIVYIYPFFPGPGISYHSYAWRRASWPLQEDPALTKASVQGMIQAWEYKCLSVDRASFGPTYSGGHVIYKIRCSAEDTDPQKTVRTYYFLWPKWDVAPRPYIICPDRSQRLDYPRADDETPLLLGLYICEQFEDYFSATYDRGFIGSD